MSAVYACCHCCVSSLLSALAVRLSSGRLVLLVSLHRTLREYCWGEDHRFYLPGSVLIGGLVLSLASIAAKNSIPGVMVPVGIVTSLVGVPFVFKHCIATSGESLMRGVNAPLI